MRPMKVFIGYLILWGICAILLGFEIPAGHVVRADLQSARMEYEHLQCVTIGLQILIFGLGWIANPAEPQPN